MADPIVAPVAQISNTPYAAPLTPAVATQVLSQYGIDPNQVLSSGNIQQTTTNPAPAPDDLLGIRAGLYNTLGVNQASQDNLNAQKAASDAALGLNERLTGLRGRAVSLNKITGTQAQERAVSSNEIDALNAASVNALNQYQAKKSEADAQFAIRESEVTQKKALMAQYPGAKISFTDSFESSMKKIDNYAQDQKKEVYKDALKAKALDLGLKTNGSSKDLEKRIGKQNKSAVADAKKKSDLELVKLQADIDNTRSEIANRGNVKATTYTNQEITQTIDTLTQQAIQSGKSPEQAWNDTALKLRSAGIDITSGSYADNQLRGVFGSAPIASPAKSTSGNWQQDFLDSMK